MLIILLNVKFWFTTLHIVLENHCLHYRNFVSHLEIFITLNVQGSICLLLKVLDLFVQIHLGVFRVVRLLPFFYFLCKFFLGLFFVFLARLFRYFVEFHDSLLVVIFQILLILVVTFFVHIPSLWIDGTDSWIVERQPHIDLLTVAKEILLV